MATGNGYFQHTQTVMDFAYRLVKEYEQHEIKQDRAYRKAHPFTPIKPKRVSKPGGMIKT
jgi:hypothetical protein